MKTTKTLVTLLVWALLTLCVATYGLCSHDFETNYMGAIAIIALCAFKAYILKRKSLPSKLPWLNKVNKA